MMKASNCSSGVSVDVYWRYLADEGQDAHIDAMVEALFGALQSEERRWSPPAQAHTKALFRRLLNKAGRGEIVPVDEVKSLRGGRDSLFELRWNNIDVLEISDQRRKYLKTGARLIHAEPIEVSVGMVGLIAHEKSYVGSSAAIQERFITEAEQIYNQGIKDLWGIALRKR